MRLCISAIVDHGLADQRLFACDHPQLSQDRQGFYVSNVHPLLFIFTGYDIPFHTPHGVHSLIQ